MINIYIYIYIHWWFKWMFCASFCCDDCRVITETKMSSFWRNFNHWLHWKLSKWQLSVQPMIKISSKWRHFCFSDWLGSNETILKNIGEMRRCLTTNKYDKIRNRGDFVTWKCFWCYWPFVRGIHPWPIDSPHKGPLMRKFYVSSLCAWTSCVERNVELPVISLKRNVVSLTKFL